MSDEEVRPPEPVALGVQDLELLVSIELDRFPVTLAELQRWRPGEIVNLRRAPSDTVSLVFETGAQRRVLEQALAQMGEIAVRVSSRRYPLVYLQHV